MDNPEGHDAPVQDNEDAKVELEHRGKQGEGDDSGSDGKEVPAELDDDSQVADGLLVIAGISQGLLVGGQGPGQGDQGGCCCHTCNTSVPHQKSIKNELQVFFIKFILKNDFVMLDLSSFIHNGSLYFLRVYICSVIMLSIFIVYFYEALCTVWCDMTAINESRKEIKKKTKNFYP